MVKRKRKKKNEMHMWTWDDLIDAYGDIYKEKIKDRNALIFMLAWVLIGLWFGLFLGAKFMMGYFSAIIMAFIVWFLMFRFKLFEDEE